MGHSIHTVLEWADMEKDRTQRTKWGESLISHFLAVNIDRVMLNPDFFVRQIYSEPLTNLMISSLCTHKVPSQIYEHIKIDFTHPKVADEMPKYEEPILQSIEKTLTEEFGSEVMRRVTLSFSEEKTHSLTHQDCI